ncbi:MAG: DinB family protein [Flavobacteriales bacterium]
MDEKEPGVKEKSMNLSPVLHQAITHQHNMLDQMIPGISPEQIHRPPAPDKWSIHDQIVHLAVYQPVFIERIHKILKEDSPAFGRYIADTDENFLSARKKTTAEMHLVLKTDRDKLVSLLGGLTKEQIQRKGIHPLFGPMTISQWTEFFILHEAHHLFSVFKLRNYQQQA